MAITVQCPNTGCGQLLNVRDELAGKAGKCPSCGSVIAIPARSSKDLSSPRRAVAPIEEPAKEEEKGAGQAAPDQAAAEAPAAGESAAAKAAEQPAEENQPLAASRFTLPALVAGIGALVLLSLCPRMNWVYLASADRRTATLVKPDSDTVTPILTAGLSAPFLVYSAGLALLALAVLTLFQLGQRDAADAVLVVVGSTAVGWGVAAAVWLSGYIAKVFSLWTRAAEGLTILPSTGLIAGLLAALAVTGAFGILVVSRGKRNWVLTAAALGGVLGLLLMLGNARPWDAWTVLF
jgi:hypothetical protein